MTNVPFINSITNEMQKRKLKSNVVANALLDISIGNEKLDDVLSIKSSAIKIDSLATLKANTIVLDGDSIAELNGRGDYQIVQNKLYSLRSQGFFSWGNVLLNQRFKLLKNLGVGGDRTDNLLSRFDITLSYKSKYVLINIGKNDILQGINTSIIIDNFKTIIERIISNGSVAVIATITPNTTSTGTQVNDIFTVNNYLKSLQYTTNDLIILDFYSSIVDTTTGLARTGMLSDGTHPSTRGGYWMGLEIYNKFNSLLLPIDIFDNTNLSDPLIPNSMMLGSNVGKATGWTSTVTGTPIFTKESRSRGMEWQVIQMVTGEVVSFVYTKIGGLPPVGSYVSFFVEYEVDSAATNIDGVYCSVLAYKSDWSAVNNTSVGLQLDSNLTIRSEDTPTKGIIYCPAMIISSLDGILNFQIRAKLNGKIRIGRVKTVVTTL